MHRDRLQLLAVAAAATLLAVAAYNRRRRRSVRAPPTAATPASPQSTTEPAAITKPAGAPADTPAVVPAVVPAETPASAAGAETEPRARGAAVLLRNLKGKPEFNGREGRVLEYDAARGRYSVRLLQNGAVAARTLQVKPGNLIAAPPKNGHLSAPELCLLTLSDHATVTAVQMEGVISLLSSGQHGQQLTEADLSLLLRVVCCFSWHVAAHRDRATGAETTTLLPHPEHGNGLVLCTAPQRLKEIGQVATHPTPEGADKCASLVRGASLFLSDVLTEARYLSLNPEDATPQGPGRFTMLTTPVYPALQYMAAGLRLEEALIAVAAACEGEGEYGDATRLFTQHAFFCYDTSQQGGKGIMPLNAVAEEGSFMMLFTGPELLELAGPSLQQLGAFNVAANVQPAQVPAKNVYECLCAADAMHAGVAINVYVPGLDARYMAPALRKEPLCRLFAHHEAEAEAARQALAASPTEQAEKETPRAEPRAWIQTPKSSSGPSVA